MIGASKLNSEDIEQIRNLFSNTNMSDIEISKKFGVSRVHINRIRNGIRWNTENHSFLMKDDIYEHKMVIGEPAPYYPLNHNQEKKSGIFKQMFWHIGKFFICLSNN
jgi:hypothetical protein